LWTSSVLDGPPMFIKTMAVGPFAPAEFCVTGGATVALPLLHREAHDDRNKVAGELDVARFTACVMGVRMAMVKRCWSEELSLDRHCSRSYCVQTACVNNSGMDDGGQWQACELHSRSAAGIEAGIKHHVNTRRAGHADAVALHSPASQTFTTNSVAAPHPLHPIVHCLQLLLPSPQS
jgi:hypothetical protein